MYTGSDTDFGKGGGGLTAAVKGRVQEGDVPPPAQNAEEKIMGFASRRLFP